MHEALKDGADHIATGHYCRAEVTDVSGSRVTRLLAGLDRNKDQSYFLCQVSQKQLENVLFPLGALTKPEVRKIAVDLGLATAARKDSQGICFVGKVDLPVFLQQKLEAKKGRIIIIPPDSSFRVWPDGLPGEETPASVLAEHGRTAKMEQGDGQTAGAHNGAHFFTPSVSARD